MELVVSGTNFGIGGYVYKMSFILQNNNDYNGDPVPQDLTVVNQTVHSSYINRYDYSLAVPVEVIFTSNTANELIISIKSPTNPTQLIKEQNFVSTLIAYPTVRLGDVDWAIEAI
jgi:hypothetical protein